MADDPPWCIPGDAGKLALTAANFKSIADSSRLSRTRLSNSQEYLVWEGLAFDAFLPLLHDLPDILQKIEASFSLAYTALSTYASNLESSQGTYSSQYSRFVTLRDQIQTVEQRLQAASPDQQMAYQKELESYLQEQGPIYRQLEEVYLQTAQDAAILTLRLQEASNSGIKNDFGNTFSRYAGDVGGIIENVVTGLWNSIVDFVKSYVQYLQTLAKMLNDIAHGDWAQLGRDSQRALELLHNMARDLNSILSTLSPILGLIPGVGEFVGLVILTTAVIMVGDDVALGATGDKKKGYGWSELGGDGINLALSAVAGAGSAAKTSTLNDIKAMNPHQISGYLGYDRRMANLLQDASPAQAANYASLVKSDQALARYIRIPTGGSPFTSLSAFRSSLVRPLQNYRDINIVNPTIFSHGGVNITLRTWEGISLAKSGVSHVVNHPSTGAGQNNGQ